jgi:hypothetical protein
MKCTHSYPYYPTTSPFLMVKYIYIPLYIYTVYIYTVYPIKSHQISLNPMKSALIFIKSSLNFIPLNLKFQSHKIPWITIKRTRHKSVPRSVSYRRTRLKWIANLWLGDGASPGVRVFWGEAGEVRHGEPFEPWISCWLYGELTKMGFGILHMSMY